MILGLAIPALSMNTGRANTTAYATTTPAARTLQGLNRQGLPSAVVFPVQILTQGGAAGAARIAQIAAQTPGVYTALAPDTPSFRQGSAALVSVIPRQQGNTSAGQAPIGTLRSRLTSVPGGAQVGGKTARLRAGSPVWGGAAAGREGGGGSGGPVGRSSSWAAQGSAVGQGVEP